MIAHLRSFWKRSPRSLNRAGNLPALLLTIRKHTNTRKHTQTHANTRKHTQTHGETHGKHTTKTRKHTETHAFFFRRRSLPSGPYVRALFTLRSRYSHSIHAI